MNARIPSLAAIIACFALAACGGDSSPPSSKSEAITHGALDGNAHPAVGLLVMDVNGSPAFRCSGTFIAPTVFLTAGHCAGEPGEFSGMRVFTESDVQDGNNNFPLAGPNTIEAVEWHAHPPFTEAQFFLHDVGVVILSQAFRLPAGPGARGASAMISKLLVERPERTWALAAGAIDLGCGAG